MSEAQLHQSVVDWLVLEKPECFWTTLEHGSSGIYQASRNKRMGVMGGLPDMMFIINGLVFFIELKVPKRYPSAQQKACHRLLRSFGSHVTVCRSLDEVIGTLAAWGMT